MEEIKHIESLASRYAAARDKVLACALDQDKEIEAVKKRKRAAISKAVLALGQAEGALIAAVEARPQLFKKPKTHVFSDIRVGFAKAKGELKFGNCADVIGLIRKKLKDKADLLISTKETLSRTALQKLPAVELKKIGVNVVNTGDCVVVKAIDTDSQKYIAALMRDVNN